MNTYYFYSVDSKEEKSLEAPSDAEAFNQLNSIYGKNLSGLKLVLIKGSGFSTTTEFISRAWFINPDRNKSRFSS